MRRASRVDEIVARARRLRADGADVIDLGCLPETRFDHLEDSVQALKAEGFTVSVDSIAPDELLRGGRAGADYLLSLTLDTLWVADEVAATPILIPRVPSDEASLHAGGRDHAAAGPRRSWPTRSSTRSRSAWPRRSCATTACASAFPRRRS